MNKTYAFFSPKKAARPRTVRWTYLLALALALALVGVLALPTSCQKDLLEDPSDPDSVELEARDSYKIKTRGEFVELMRRMKSYRDYFAVTNDIEPVTLHV